MGGYEISIPVEMEPTSGIPPCFDFYSNPGPLIGCFVCSFFGSLVGRSDIWKRIET